MYTGIRWKTPAASARASLVVLLSAFALGSCTLSPRPALHERQLTHAGKVVNVQSLDCTERGLFIASGFTLDISPGANGEPAAYLSGYQYPPGLGRQLIAQYSVKAGPWWQTPDHGRSWHAAPARLAFGNTAGFMMPLPDITQVQEKPATLLYLTPVPGHGLMQPGLAMMRSTDAGRTWRQTNWPDPIQFPALATDGKGRVVLTGRLPPELLKGPQSDPVYWSADGGASWNRSEDQHFSRMRLFYTQTGYVLAFNQWERKYGSTLLLYSADHGKSFVRSRDPSLEATGVMAALISDSQGRVIAVTQHGYLLLSRDSGVSWRITGRFDIRDVGLLSHARLIAYDSGVVVALLAGGAIARSVDRGETWRRVESPIPQGHYAFTAHCANDKGLIFATGNGIAIRSLDYGASWQPSSLP